MPTVKHLASSDAGALTRESSPAPLPPPFLASFFSAHIHQVTNLIGLEISTVMVACMRNINTYMPLMSLHLIAILSPTDSLICISWNHLLLCFASKSNSLFHFF